MDIATAKRTIVTPALKSIGLASPAAINLVTGIGAVESGYLTRHQVGGPALGFWQMEPFTHDDCWENFLTYRPLLAGLIRKIADPLQPSSALLVCNDLYAASMCRVKLFRSPELLPPADDALGMSLYHKKWYNSYMGKANPQVNVPLFQEAIDA